MSDLLQDLRFAARQLRKNPGFALAAIVCLAIGIGANTSAFSFAWGVLFKAPPLESPERMVRLYTDWESGLEYGSFSYPDFVDLRDRSGEVLETLTADSMAPVHLSTGGQNQRVWAEMVSANYFTGLGVPMARGRGFSSADGEAPGSMPLVVLSHRAWVGRFGRDEGIVGRSVSVNGHPYTVVGVTHEDFLGTTPGVSPEVYVPLLQGEQIQPGFDFLEVRGSHSLAFVIGRMRPGVTFEQASAQLQTVMAQLSEEYPDTNVGKGLTVLREREASLPPQIRQGFVNASVLVFVVVGFILLLACANVAGLLVARAAARRKEIGIRMALGGGRSRLVRQLLVESGLLAVLAAAAGLVLSIVLERSLLASVPDANLPIYMEYRLHPEVLLFTVGASALTGMLFGLIPAYQATRDDVITDLKEGLPGMGGTRSTRLRQALVVGQVALSLVLLVSAGFVLRSLQAVSKLDPGFKAENQLIANLDLDLQGYDEERGRIFQRELQRRLEEKPEIEAVGYAALLPLAFSSSSTSVIPEGHEDWTRAEVPSINFNVVDHRFFKAAGVRVDRGRGFLETDDGDSPPVVIVNHAFVERFWPGEEAVGKRLENSGLDFEVVGVAQNGKYFTLGEDQKAFVYFSEDQRYRGGVVLHVRTKGDPRNLIPVVRAEVAALDDKLPVTGLRTMESHLEFAMLPVRMMATVVGAFGVVALLLAAVGLYGVLAFWVNQGVRDLAIRMAMGARPSDVVLQVVKRGVWMTGIGLAIGLAASVGIGVVVSKLVFGVSASDPFAYLVGVVVLLGASVLAAFLPAFRASRLDPVLALKAE